MSEPVAVGWRGGLRAVVLAAAACGGSADPDGAAPDAAAGAPAESPASGAEDAGGWEKLPAPPLSGRTGAVVASLGTSIVVTGGWNYLCPPDADCVLPDEPPHVDGAAYHLDSGQWTSIADAPIGLLWVAAAAVGADLYVLSQCNLGAPCAAGLAFLRYRSADDEWDVLPGPDENDPALGGYGLVAVDDGVVAYSQSDEFQGGPDFRFSATQGQWVALPNDPLPPMYDRFVVGHAGRLLLFGSPIDGGDRTKLVASHDPESQTWQELTASGTMGFQVWRAGALFYLNPHFRGAGGGVYDPELNRWSPLPNPPHHDMAGIIGEDEATYAYAAGWVLDTRSGGWLSIEPRPDAEDVYDVVVATAPEQGLVVFGGQTWTSGEGQLVNDTWLWRPPAPSGSTR